MDDSEVTPLAINRRGNTIPHWGKSLCPFGLATTVFSSKNEMRRPALCRGFVRELGLSSPGHLGSGLCLCYHWRGWTKISKSRVVIKKKKIIFKKRKRNSPGGFFTVTAEPAPGICPKGGMCSTRRQAKRWQSNSFDLPLPSVGPRRYLCEQRA